MFTYSPQDKKIAEIIQITPFKSCEPLVLNTVWGYLDDPRLFFCFVLVVHESLVCSEQLNWALFFRQIPTFCRFCSFPAFLHIWTLSSSDCMILRSIFSHWGQLMDSNTTIKKGSNIHWCSRRTHDALRAGGWKLFEFEDQGKLYLICLPGNMQVSSVASEGQ